MSDEIAPDETVWVSTGFSGDDCTKCLHVDPECRNLNRARRIVEKRRDVYPPDQRVCEICTGKYEPHAGGGRSKAYQILKEAGGDD